MSRPIRMAVIGSREGWPTRADVYSVLDGAAKTPGLPLVILSGGARGADTYAHDWAHDSGVPFELFAADWDAHGKAAGPIRNRALVAAADCVIAFWDGESPGTRQAIAAAKKAGRAIAVYGPDGTTTHYNTEPGASPWQPLTPTPKNPPSAEGVTHAD